jgi:sulfatase modifying factor 1
MKLAAIPILGFITCIFMNNAGAGIEWSADEAPQPIVNDAGADPSTEHFDKEAPEPVNLCPTDMVFVEGDYCPNAEETCLYYVDRNGKKTNQIGGRCGEFKYPTKCLSNTKIHKRFCIDKFAWPNKEGELPQDWMSWDDAKKAVESVGKRLCTDSEFTMAAEGPDMHPLAYGNGYVRNNYMCNMDHEPNINVFKAKTPNSPTALELRALLVPSGSKPLCVSDYGVHDMAGNIDCWVVNESGHPYVSALKGGHVFGVRNAARPSTTAHAPYFAWYETGTRACLDAK